MRYNIPFYSLKKIHQDSKSELLKVFEEVFKNNQFILGEYLDQFEKAFAKYIGTTYAIGVGNGYDGLKIALKSLALNSNNEIIIPAHTFSASISAAIEAGIRPVLVDVDLKTYHINTDLISGTITPETRAIMPVHIYGNPCHMKSIMELADTYQLYLIEDYAQSVGASYNGRQTGSFGNVNVTSFYPTKTLGALGDGGIITTNIKNLNELCRQYRNYGYITKYNLITSGFNSRLDEIQAAFLLYKLKYLDQWQLEKNQIAKRYFQNLSDNEHIILPVERKNVKQAHHIFPIRIHKRNELQQFLTKYGIQTQIHYPIPPHLQPGFKFLSYKKGNFPNTEIICDTELSLPIYPGLNLKHVDLISELIISFTSKL